MKAGDLLPVLERRVTARMVIMGASASRDWQPQHHDFHWATERAGTPDIFLNTPTQAGWIERYLTDWTGPYGRLGWLNFRMRRPICDGDVVTFEGRVTDVRPTPDCVWVHVDLILRVGDEAATECAARIAVPGANGQNPWRLIGDAWKL